LSASHERLCDRDDTIARHVSLYKCYKEESTTEERLLTWLAKVFMPVRVLVHKMMKLWRGYSHPDMDLFDQ
jgi:arsenate reductase-like glutaredoxin family protein